MTETLDARTVDLLRQRPLKDAKPIHGDVLRVVEDQLENQLRYDLEHFAFDHQRLRLVTGPLAVQLATIRLALAADRANDLKEGV